MLHDNQADYAGTLCGGAQSYVLLLLFSSSPSTVFQLTHVPNRQSLSQEKAAYLHKTSTERRASR